MYAQNFLAPSQIRTGNSDLPVKTPRTQQSGIKHVFAVCRRHDNDALIGFKTIHFNQKLIEGLLTLVISTAVARAPRPANRVDFINEQNAGRIFFRLLKHIADAARTDTHKHLHKIRTRDREERHARFPRNGPRKKGLTRARRAFQQGSFGNFTAQSAKFLRIL